MATPKKKTRSQKKDLKMRHSGGTEVKNKKNKRVSKTKELKKITSSPSETTMNVIKALRKTRSLNAPTPTPSSTSPKSVQKKAISENLQKKIIKKRKREKPISVSDNNQGVKLLKRGCVTMHRIIRRKIRGIKLNVSFNAKGEPFGKEAAEMQSYIGVLARTKPPIWHDTWKCVPQDTKTKIWECVQVRQKYSIKFIYFFIICSILTLLLLLMYVDGFCRTSICQEDGFEICLSKMEGVQMSSDQVLHSPLS